MKKKSPNKKYDLPRYQQAELVFKAFGGARRLCDALECIGVVKRYSTVYRWGYAKRRGGTDGIIPYKMLKAVALAAENASVRINKGLLKPEGIDSCL